MFFKNDLFRPIRDIVMIYAIVSCSAEIEQDGQKRNFLCRFSFLAYFVTGCIIDSASKLNYEA